MRALFASRILLLTMMILLFTGPYNKALAAEDQKSLEKKVSAEWDAKVKRNWGKVYDLAIADFKKNVSKDHFLQASKLEIKEYSIKEVRVIEANKKAKVTLSYKTPQRGIMFDLTSEEEWVMEKGHWALVLLTPKEAMKRAFPD